MTQPVAVTRNGRERTVMISAEEYHRLKRRDRQVLSLEDFSAADIQQLLLGGGSRRLKNGKWALLDTGAVDLISFWDPAVAGEACNKIALMKISGEEVGAGSDLGLPGYDKLTGDGKVLYGQAWVDVTKDNKAEYPF